MPPYQRDISFITHSGKGNKKHRTYLKNQHGFLFACAPGLMSFAFHDIATRSVAHWIFFCYSLSNIQSVWRRNVHYSLHSWTKTFHTEHPLSTPHHQLSNPSLRLAPPHSSLFFILLFMLFLVLGLLWRCAVGYFMHKYRPVCSLMIIPE